MFSGPIGKTRWLPWPLIGWDIFDFSSELAERNSTKFDRKQDLNVLYQVCDIFFFEPIGNTRLPPWPLLGWVSWMEFNKSWQEASSQSTQVLIIEVWCKPLLQFNETWQGARSQCPLQSLCFSSQSEKNPRCLPRSLIAWDIFDFYSETSEWNSTKLDRKQDLKVLKCTLCSPLGLLLAHLSRRLKKAVVIGCRPSVCLSYVSF